MSVVGVIEFDPEQRDANGKMVTQFPIIGPNQIKVRVTVWPELKLPDGLLTKGLLVGVRGKYNQGRGSDNTVYHNLSANTISVGSDVFTKDEAPVVKKSSGEAAF